MSVALCPGACTLRGARIGCAAAPHVGSHACGLTPPPPARRARTVRASPSAHLQAHFARVRVRTSANQHSSMDYDAQRRTRLMRALPCSRSRAQGRACP
eukprot:5159595-Pleurochrysis_carterae.AAC.1